MTRFSNGGTKRLASRSDLASGIERLLPKEFLLLLSNSFTFYPQRFFQVRKVGDESVFRITRERWVGEINLRWCH